MYEIKVMDAFRAFTWVYNHSYQDDCPKYAIISIQESTGGVGRGVQYCAGGHCAAALNIEFDDLDVDTLVNMKDSPREVGCTPMTDEDAVKIRDFVDSLDSLDINLLLIHCYAGVSRSAAVAASVYKVKTGDDRAIFGSGKYMPNMYVYRKMLQAWGLQNDGSAFAGADKNLVLDL